MRFSVWNQSLGAFDYYEGGVEQRVLNTEKPKHLVSRTLGSTVDQAAWPLPANARKIGSGPDAIGRVASRRMGGALGDDLGGDNAQLVKAALLAGAGYLLWKYVVKAPRRRHS